MARTIIIDTDPGIDDAVAILLALAADELAVEGIVTVAGNVPLAATTRNACALIELAGHPEVPIHAGCPRPMAAAWGGRADGAHGTGGLGDLVLPVPAATPRPEHGVAWLVETLRQAAPQSVTLCALGPLTNIAAALVMAPEIAAAVAELALMGGGSRGNITRAAEFNIHCDPQAAAIVFESGLPITMVPLDVTETVRSTDAHIAPIRSLGTRCGDAVAQLIGPRRGLGRPAMAMHDPCVVGWLLAPELFRTREAHVAVETRGVLTSGMTVIDPPGKDGRAANARVVEAIEADGLYRLLAERLTGLP